MSAEAPQAITFQPGPLMPNSHLPVLIYRQVLPQDETNKAGGFDRLFEQNGWRGIWRDSVYDYDHYHSNAHEVLGVAKGKATLQLGGETGQAVEVAAGDVLLLPAGTGHRCISGSENFVVIGAYPPGQEHYDICRTREPAADLRISKVKLPQTDPVGGSDGPVMRLWK